MLTMYDIDYILIVIIVMMLIMLLLTVIVIILSLHEIIDFSLSFTIGVSDGSSNFEAIPPKFIPELVDLNKVCVMMVVGGVS